MVAMSQLSYKTLIVVSRQFGGLMALLYSRGRILFRLLAEYLIISALTPLVSAAFPL